MTSIARYGIDFYGLGLYGSLTSSAVTTTGTSTVALFSNLTAKPYVDSSSGTPMYNTIRIDWADPSVNTPNFWSKTIIVRNQYGYPVTPYDGTQVVVYNNGDSISKYYVDSNVPSGYQYYSLFVYVYNSYTNSFSWVVAATATALSVPKLGNTSIMYNLLPDIMKITSPYEATMDWDNPVLYSFLDNFGFQLDYLQEQTNLLTRRYNVETVNGALIPSMLQQFGMSYEPSIGLEQNRTLLRDSIVLYSKKGSLQGTIGYLKDYTGYPISSNVIGTSNITTAHADGSSITYYCPNFFSVGQTVTVTGVNPSTFNVTAVPITSVSNGRFSVASSVSGEATGGVAKITASNPATNGLVIGHNLMLDYNDSSFEEGYGNWISKDGSGIVTAIRTQNILSGVFTYVSGSTGTATITLDGSHMYNVGNNITVTGFSQPVFNINGAAITAVNQTAGTISYAVTYTASVSKTSGLNAATNTYATVTPVPNPWIESTAPSLFPNKQSGILTVQNSSGTVAQNVDAYCGDAAPVTKGIPVTPGLGYCFSFYTAYATTARAVQASIKWYDRTGTIISAITGANGSSGTTLTNNTTSFNASYRPYIAGNAPSNAAYAVPGVIIQSAAAAEFHYFDAAQFEQAYVPTSFDEARQLHLTIKAVRINELVNPHFATPLTPWQILGASSVSTGAIAEPNVDILTISTVQIGTGVNPTATVTLTGPHTFTIGSSVQISNVVGSGVNAAYFNGKQTVTAVSQNSFSFTATGASSLSSVSATGTVWVYGNTLQLTATSTSTATVTSWDGISRSQLMGVYYPGTSYTFSVHAYEVEAVETGTEKIFLNINWYDSSYNYISSSGGSSEVYLLEGQPWERYYTTGTAPINAAYASVQIQWSPATVGDVVNLDSALFENTGLLLPYFDGSNGPGLLPYDFMWEGNAINAGRSHYYKNRYNVQTRLAGLVNNLIPTGSTAAFYIAQPNT